MILLKNLMMNESLTEYEKNLIYGSLLENINDVVIMNEADATREYAIRTKQAQDIRNRAAKTENGIIKSELEQTARNLDWAAAKNRQKIRDEEKTDALTREKIKNPLDENMVDNYRAREENLQLNIEKATEQKNKQIENLKKHLKAAIDNRKRAEDAQKIVTNNPGGNKIVQTQTSLGESTQPSNNSTEFLFKGESGKLLDHFINKKSLQEYSLQQLAQDLESNSEAQVIIKKIEFYIRKMGSGLDYDSYIDLKVQNGKFKALVKKTKEDRLNKIRS